MSIFPKHLADLLLLSALLSMSLLVYLHHLHHPLTAASFYPESPPPLLSHVLFSIAGISSSLPSRAPFIRMWYSPISRLNTTFLFLFLDRAPPQPSLPSLPPIIIQTNTSSRHRIIKDAIALHVPGIHWYVFGDGHTVFFTKDLVRILSKYDHTKWYYIGSSSASETYNEELYFEMAYGGGGVLISAPLAKLLDSCLDRYNHLFGSNAPIFACLAELGVPFTLETEFHSY